MPPADPEEPDYDADDVQVVEAELPDYGGDDGSAVAERTRSRSPRSAVAEPIRGRSLPGGSSSNRMFNPAPPLTPLGPPPHPPPSKPKPNRACILTPKWANAPQEAQDRSGGSTDRSCMLKPKWGGNWWDENRSGGWDADDWGGNWWDANHSGGWDADRSGGSTDRIGGSPVSHESFQIPNLMFGTFYCTGATNVEAFMALLRRTPMYFIVVFCESTNDAVAVALRTGFPPGEDTPRVVHVDDVPIFLISHRYSVVACGIQILRRFVDASYAVVRIQIENQDTAVAVGVVNVDIFADEIRHEIKDAIIASLHDDKVRCITGVFGRCRGDMEDLLRDVPRAAPVVRTSFQSAQVEEVFPSYIIFIGSCHDSSFPNDAYLPFHVAVSKGWVSDIAHFPASEVLPFFGDDNRGSAVADQGHFALDINWGHIKSKRIDPLRWIKGVHQVVVWCGTATQGAGAKMRRIQKS